MRAARDRLLRGAFCGYSVLLGGILPPSWLASIDPTRRQRSYGHIPVLWAWVAQVLEGNVPCARAAALVQSWHRDSGLHAPSGSSSSYCEARARIDGGFLSQVAGRTRVELAGRAGSEILWKGLALRAIDGSSVQLMDTPENQEAYPHHRGRPPGAGSPSWAWRARQPLPRRLGGLRGGQADCPRRLGRP